MRTPHTHAPQWPSAVKPGNRAARISTFPTREQDGLRVSKKNKAPTWRLDDHWAVDTDPFNWILYKRGTKKDGSPGKWNPTGYYATAEKLLMSLYHQLTRLEPQDKDLVKHLEAISRHVQAAAARLSDELNQMAWSHLRRPPAHPELTDD